MRNRDGSCGLLCDRNGATPAIRPDRSHLRASSFLPYHSRPIPLGRSVRGQFAWGRFAWSRIVWDGARPSRRPRNRNRRKAFQRRAVRWVGWGAGQSTGQEGRRRKIWTATLILLTTLHLLISEKLLVDLTASGILVAPMVAGIPTPTRAVAGFANPAVVTVAAMFLIGRAMIRTGALGFVARHIVADARGKSRLAILLVLLIVGVASAFVNNAPVVVLFIPVILSPSCECGIGPSKFLIPASCASILAGTRTLVGASTNIIVRDITLE
ncbi:MAG: SLC13 family permease [Desulfococcaceae bacterium]